MDLKYVCESLQQFFSKKEMVACVYLFGSVVKDKDSKHSDIDIAVLFEEGFSSEIRFNQRLKFISELEDLLGKKVDVVDLDACDVYFIHQVMLKNILVFERNQSRRVSFEVKKRKMFFDMKPFYDLYYKQMLKRMDGGT